MEKIFGNAAVRAVCPISKDKVHFQLNARRGKISDSITVCLRLGRPEFQLKDERCVPIGLRRARDECVARNGAEQLASGDADICDLVADTIVAGFLPGGGEYEGAFGEFGHEADLIHVRWADFNRGLLPLISAEVTFTSPLKLGGVETSFLKEAVQPYLDKSIFFGFPIHTQNVKEAEAGFASLLNVRRQIELGLEKIIVPPEVTDDIAAAGAPDFS